MRLTFAVENVKCGGCRATIERSLLAFEGVRSVEVDIEAGEARLETDRPADGPLYLKKLAALGYPEAGHNGALPRARSFVSCALGKMST